MITWLLISIMMRYPPGTFCAIICTWILKEMADFQFVNAFGYSKHYCVEKVEKLFNMAAVSKWLPMNSFWPSVLISASSQVRWDEISWGTSFVNKNIITLLIRSYHVSKMATFQNGGNQNQPISVIVILCAWRSVFTQPNVMNGS